MSRVIFSVFVVVLALFGGCGKQQPPQILNRATITVDRETPLEVQFAQLATEGKILYKQPSRVTLFLG